MKVQGINVNAKDSYFACHIRGKTYKSEVNLRSHKRSQRALFFEIEEMALFYKEVAVINRSVVLRICPAFSAEV